MKKILYVSNLISPLVDDRHVNIVNKNSHFLSGRRTVSRSHSLVDIALYSSLNVSYKNKYKVNKHWWCIQKNIVKVKRENTWNMLGVVADEKFIDFERWTSGSYLPQFPWIVTVLAVPCSPINNTACNNHKTFNSLIPVNRIRECR